jgi:hypothetical protein
MPLRSQQATTQFSVTLNTVTPGSAGITASVTSAQHDPTLPDSSNVTVTITEDRRETGRWGGGGGATSLLTLLLGLLPRRLRSRRHAVGLDEARHAAAHEVQTDPYGRDSRVTI